MKTNQTETNEEAVYTCTTAACDTIPAAPEKTNTKDNESYDSTCSTDQHSSADEACDRPARKGAKVGSKALLIASLISITGVGSTFTASADERPQHQAVTYNHVEIEGQKIFYREAGSKDSPTILLLHGFPTSSHMFRNLIPQLADKYHVIAPDMPGYGQSSAPSVEEFEYSFDHMASIIEQFTQKTELEKYSLYLMDYGAPVGFRVAAKNPEKVQSLIIQNGNAYDEGLREFWVPLKAYWKDQSVKNADALRGLLTIDATKWQYTHGVRNETVISPDNWTIDQRLLDRKGNQEIQLAMFLSYGSNPPLYPKWQSYLRTHQPPTLIVWGKNDQIFPADGAHPYKKDLKNLEFHLLDTGHFALEEDGDKIAQLMRGFLSKNVKK